MSEQSLDTPAHKAALAAIIKKSGCTDIQEVIAAIKAAGMSLTDLDLANLENTLLTMASAQSVGG